MEGQLPDVAPRRDPIDPVESEFAVACAAAAAVSRVRWSPRPTKENVFCMPTTFEEK